MKFNHHRTAVAGSLCTAMLASAQTSVTVYGLVDAGVELSRAGTTDRRVISGGGGGSRIGFRGSEDLGGGVSAVFRIEQGFNLDTGTLAQGGRAFGREASVGLASAGWGSVSLGRLPMPYYAVLSGADAFGWMGSGGMMALTKTGAGGQQVLPLAVDARRDNAVGYVSPRWGGLEARALVSAGENAGAGGVGKGYGASARYTQGSIDLLAGYTRVGAPVGGAGHVAGAALGGSVDLKLLRVFAGLAQERNSCTACSGALARIGGVAGRDAAEFRLANVGVRMPVGPAVAIAQVTRVNDRSRYAVAPGNRDATWLGLGAEYALSRRTLVYSSLATIGNRNGSLYALGSGTVQQPAGRVGAGDPRATTLALGMRHSF